MRLSPDDHLEKTTTLAGASSRDDREEGLLRALEEFRAAMDRGESPDRATILARHSDVAEELSACLDSLDFITNVAPQLGEADEEHDRERDGESPSPAAPVDGLLGDFRLLREIGRGGMGVVYEAEQISLSRRVALKVLPFAAMLDKQQLKRFQNEARAAATLDHPHIVQVHFVGCERGVHFYAMQLIEGQSLAEVIAEMQASQSGKPKAESGESQAESASQSPAPSPQSPSSKSQIPNPKSKPSSPSPPSANPTGPPTFAPSPAWAFRPPKRSTMRTPKASSIATSSRPTCCSTKTAISTSPTSAWPASKPTRG